MDGKVLNAIFEKAPDLEVVDSWDDKIKSQHSSSLAQFESDELVKQLVDLGYVEQEDTGSPEAVKKLLDENNFYLSRSYFEAKKFKESRLIIQKLCSDYPENHRYWFQLARVCVEQNDPDGLQDSIGHLKSIVNPGSQGIQLLEGKLAYLRNNFEQALRIFKSIGQGEGLMNAHIAYQIASTLLKLHQYDEALKFYKEHNRLNPNSPNALHGMGMAYIGLGRYAKAIDTLIDSISIMYFNPSAHFHLGRAFRLNGNLVEAEQAFLVAKHLAPAMSKSRLELINLYENELKDESKAAALLHEMKQTSKGVVYIVSGLPRSGTSMMMQMLKAGGLNIFTDEKRHADENNPKGYLEHEAIKRLASDSSIIYQAKDQVVKVIINLLRFLPANIDYKVVLMRRSIEEIIQSQERMLVNLNKSREGDSLFEADKKWQASLEKSISYINKQPNMEVLEVYYAEVLEDPLKQAEKVQSFLGFSLELDRMTQIVEQDLYRSKI
jgi:tetratricopeptide (TPR) repeat protein